MAQIRTELGEQDEPSSVARRICRDTLRSWHVAPDLLDQVELVVSELVGNAVKHAGGARTLEITKHGERIRVAVTDRGNGVPQAMRPGLLEEGGRGLFIVTTVSNTWGYRPAAEGKTVWAEFIASADTDKASGHGMLTH